LKPEDLLATDENWEEIGMEVSKNDSFLVKNCLLFETEKLRGTPWQNTPVLPNF